ncbi:MAG: hypothetical protein AAF682_15030 [Planctomycetota bacterium]
MTIRTSQHYLLDAQDVRAFLIDVGEVDRAKLVVFYRENAAGLCTLAQSIASEGLRDCPVCAISDEVGAQGSPDYGALGLASLKEHHEEIEALHLHERGVYRIGQKNRGEIDKALYLQLPRGPAHMVFSPQGSDERLLETPYFGALSQVQQETQASDVLIVGTFEDRLPARIAAYWALTNARRAVRSVAVLTTPPDELPPDEQVCHSRLDFYVRDHRVAWHPYMNLPHFRALGGKRFQELQGRSVKALEPLVAKHKPQVLLDIGCGDGSVVKELFQSVPCLDKAYGVDPALRARTAEAGVWLEQATLDDVSSTWLEERGLDMDRTVAMFVGNTLPHIGASKFSSWLRDLKKRPAHILIDFNVIWPDLLQLGEGEVYGWDRGEKQVGSLTLRMKRVTVAVAGHLRRRVHFQYLRKRDAKQLAPGEDPEEPVAEHGFVIDQYADTKQHFFDVLNRAGYQVEAVPGTYTSGWGTHELYLCVRTDKPAQIRWPEPEAGIGRSLNQLWYQELQALWDECELDKKKLPVLDSSWYPVAVLPFDSGRMWGRYLPTGTPISKEVSDVWLRMANREDDSLPKLGTVKPIEDPVYAEEFHDALLAPVPLSVIRSLKERPAVLEHNELDEHFAAQELKHLGSQKDTAYYTIPIYLHGLPSLLLIVPVKTNVDAPELIMSILLNGRAFVAAKLEDALTRDRWFRFLQKAIAETARTVETREEALAVIRRMTDRVEYRAENDPRVWKSWLETLPGSQGVHGRKWAAFKRRHAEAYRQAVSEPYYQISTWLHELSFFKDLGHEHLTTLHQAELEPLKGRWRGMETAHHRFAQSCLDRMSEGEDAPEDDREDAPTHNAYLQGNKAFQLFKALFCRAEANRPGARYRISPISVYAAAGVYFSKEFDSIRFDGKRLDEAMVYRPEMAKPKLLCDDPWALYHDLWVTISLSENFETLDVEPVDSGCFKVTVRFEKRPSVGLAGRSLGHWIEHLEHLLPEPVEREGVPAAGYVLTFRADESQQVVLRHEWILQDDKDTSKNE